MSTPPCAVCASVHVCASCIQLPASSHRLPLWLPSWPSVPEVPHQSHVTLVPDTCVYSEHRRAQPPPEMFVLSKKKIKKNGRKIVGGVWGVCPSESVGKLSATMSESIPPRKRKPLHNRCLRRVDFGLLRLEYKNSFLVEVFMSTCSTLLWSLWLVAFIGSKKIPLILLVKQMAKIQKHQMKVHIHLHLLM